MTSDNERERPDSQAVARRLLDTYHLGICETLRDAAGQLQVLEEGLRLGMVLGYGDVEHLGREGRADAEAVTRSLDLATSTAGILHGLRAASVAVHILADDSEEAFAHLAQRLDEAPEELLLRLYEGHPDLVERFLGAVVAQSADREAATASQRSLLNRLLEIEAPSTDSEEADN